MDRVAPEIAGVSLRINGEQHALELDTRTSLLDLLRERLGLTGTKKGCDHGQCGACTVLVDGRRANACLLLAVTLDGAHVTTIEGLADGDELHPLQAAFVHDREREARIDAASVDVHRAGAALAVVASLLRAKEL